MLRESIVLRTSSSQVQYTQASGKVASVTVKESRPGLMAQSTSASGLRTKLMDRVNSFMSMGMFTKVHGPTIKRTVKEFILMQMAQSTKDSGRMIYNTAMESSHGLTRADMKDSMNMVVSMALAAISGTTEANLLVTGAKTKLADVVSTLGLMDDVMLENGMKTTWTELEFMFGTTAAFTKANTEMTKSMGLVSIPGKMAVAMKAIGIEESSMA